MAKKKSNLGMSKANRKSRLIHTGITVWSAALTAWAVAFTSPEFKDLLMTQFWEQTGMLIFWIVWLILASTFAKKYTDKK